MKFHQTFLKGAYIIEPEPFEDHRGKFVKTYHLNKFKEHQLESDFCESFYSTSKQEVIRGMHFQRPPKDHAKLIYATSGSILDVSLDIRKNSPTYGKFIAIEISEQNCKAIYIPRGFAHGFCSLTDNATVIYLQTTMHSPEHDAGIRFDSFGMEWNVINPILSQRDSSFPKLESFNSPFIYKEMA
jgi:dTDP-4-dehydrorhamnose 3,5-epimerase